MGHQIIKQPNGKYAVWSSVVDHFVMINATPEDIIEDRVLDSREIDKLEKGEDFFFGKSWEEAIETIKDIHGEADETLKELKEDGLID